MLGVGLRTLKSREMRGVFIGHLIDGIDREAMSDSSCLLF